MMLYLALERKHQWCTQHSQGSSENSSRLPCSRDITQSRSERFYEICTTVQDMHRINVCRYIRYLETVKEVLRRVHKP